MKSILAPQNPSFHSVFFSEICWVTYSTSPAWKPFLNPCAELLAMLQAADPLAAEEYEPLWHLDIENKNPPDTFPGHFKHLFHEQEKSRKKKDPKIFTCFCYLTGLGPLLLSTLGGDICI